MTDLEKWEKFLTEMGVLFKTDIQKDYSFGMNGKFKYFEPYGE